MEKITTLDGRIYFLSKWKLMEGDSLKPQFIGYMKPSELKSKYHLVNHNSKFWFSIAPIKNCIFSRRIGKHGFRIFGLSVCIRIFRFNLY